MSKRVVEFDYEAFDEYISEVNQALRHNHGYLITANGELIS